jgi:hypothetical protein
MNNLSYILKKNLFNEIWFSISNIYLYLFIDPIWYSRKMDFKQLINYYKTR